jgi:hypothetical protein
MRIPLFIFSAVFALTSWAAEGGPTLLVVTGAPGAEEFAPKFKAASEQWLKAGAAGHARTVTLGLEASQTDTRAQLQQALQKEAGGNEPLWLVLIGHGTFDGREARFNARGDDFTAAELAEWLKPVERPLIVVCAFSCSGPFLKPLSATGRMVVTATRSGSEHNYSHFGEYFSEAIADPAADLDQDGQTSLLEAWLSAAHRTAAFYQSEGRLATEHSLLDDNGDGLGTPADWFKGLRAVKKSQSLAVPDGTRARQLHLVPNAAESALPLTLRTQRDSIEVELAALRERKTTMAPAEYYQALEELLLKLARLYQAAPAAPAKPES